MAMGRRSCELSYPQVRIARSSKERQHIANFLRNAKGWQKPEYAMQSQGFSMKKLPTVQPVRVLQWVEVLPAGRYIPVN
jgi:hypothetical protein